MNKTIKITIACGIYALSICLGCWVGGTALKDKNANEDDFEKLWGKLSASSFAPIKSDNE